MIDINPLTAVDFKDIWWRVLPLHENIVRTCLCNRKSL